LMKKRVSIRLLYCLNGGLGITLSVFVFWLNAVTDCRYVLLSRGLAAKSAAQYR